MKFCIHVVRGIDKKVGYLSPRKKYLLLPKDKWLTGRDGPVITSTRNNKKVDHKMAPVPQLDIRAEELSAGTPNTAIADDGVVIAGISGLFPMSKNLKEFSDNLYDKVYMVTDKVRFSLHHPELQNFNGNVPDLAPFDAQFFGIHAKLALSMDSMSRKLLEHTYQAIYDSGLNVDHVRKSKLGVFIGSCFSETEKACFYVAENRTGFGIMGCCKAMFANRISYWLDAKGPSMSLDAMCASSMVALKHAIEAIRSGECDSAIVGSANICLHPQSSILYGRTIKMSEDGVVRAFDKDANGTVRSEAINVLFLQKAKDAKRVYAELCHAECDFIPETNDYGHLRSVSLMRNFFTEFYQKANVSPNEVGYIEAFGTGVPEADKNELEAISEVFCKDRTDPLLVGSVMSNMGYSEAASGISSIVKVCLAYHTGKIAANLHCDQPRQDVDAIRDGRLRVVTDHMPTQRAYCAVNNFSIGGLNSHVLLRGYNNKNEHVSYKTSLPYLVTISGRHDDAVKTIAEELKSQPVDPEKIALLHNIHEASIVYHMSRGYCILSTNAENGTKVISEKCDYYSDVKRPLWFVYSGMGSQWATMGTELMRIPIFAAAIERCRNVLEPVGIDLIDILTNPDKKTYDNILNSFVGIAAVQIGLTDILTELGIVPDKIIGHSVGELGCAYADGCFTDEEMILAAYCRGRVSVETPFIHGSMAAVGLGYSTVIKMCPPEIEVACHNSSESCTISGPSDAMKKFVDKLTAQGVFAKEVPCSNIAYHSRYIAQAGPKLREYLSKVIKNPKERSDRWVSTSVPQDQWNLDSAKYSSAEYHTNNLLSPVLFEETSRLIPQNAVTIEVAPHGLLQAILKRSLNPNCINVPLTRRGHSDPVTFILNALGELYMAGLNPKLQVLYPKIQYPVSTGTHCLSHLPKWEHTENWPLPIYSAANRTVASQRSFVMSLYDDEYKYIEGNVIEGNNVFPLSALLVFVWETLAMSLHQNKNELSVQFLNVNYYQDAIVHLNQLFRLIVTIQKGTGYFEITSEDNLLIAGNVMHITSVLVKEPNDNIPVSYDLDHEDIYKILFRRGYFYENMFKSVKGVNSNMTEAAVTWNDDWITFIDSIFQVNTLRREYNGVSKIKYIRKLVIDTTKHKEVLLNGVSNGIGVSIKPIYNVSRCGGVSLYGMEYVDNPSCTTNNVLKKKEFMPFCPIGTIDLTAALHAHLQIVSENIDSNVIRALEIKNNQDKISIGDHVKCISKELIGFNVEFNRVLEETFLIEDKYIGHCNLLLGCNLIKHIFTNKSMSKRLTKNTLVISIDGEALKREEENKLSLVVIATSHTAYGHVTLLRWEPVQDQSNVTCLSIDKNCQLLKYTRDNLTSRDRLIVTTKYPAEIGLKDAISKWRMDSEKNKVHLYMSDDKLLSDEDFFEATRRCLTFNTYKKGVWGSDIYLPIETKVMSTRDVKLTSVSGNLDTFKWSEITNLSSKGIQVEVHYSGPNYHDSKKAAGQILGDTEVKSSYGMDFSGTTLSGERVMGVVRNGAIATRLEADPDLLWPVPDHWTMEDAATVPLPYLHAFYCLIIKAQLTPSQNVLVHGGVGAFGQAVISVALSLRCNVFATVSSIQKKKTLLELFPELKEENIGNSRDDSFEVAIQHQTQGKGCEIVINCLKGLLREASMRCVGFYGKFIDVGNRDVSKNCPFGMSYLANDRSYFPTFLLRVFQLDNKYIKLLQRVMSEGIASGSVRPITRVTYAPADVTRAFRLLATSGHRGRVLLRMREISALTPTPNISCSSDKSYIVLSGKQEFGIDVADRLVQLGAKSLVVHHEPALNTGLMRYYISSWKTKGVTVITKTEPLNNAEVISSLVKESAQLGAVEGVIVSDQYSKPVLEILDKLTRTLCVKYLAILKLNRTTFDTYEENIMNDRNKNNLNTLLLNIPVLHKFNDSAVAMNTKISESLGHHVVSQTIHNALNALELALGHSQARPVTTYAVVDAKVDIFRDMSMITGINIANTLAANTTLKELGVDIDVMEKICNYLINTLHVPFNREEIPDFTIAKLHTLQEQANKEDVTVTSEVKKNLSLFFTTIDPEEIDSSVDIMTMATSAMKKAQLGGEVHNLEKLRAATECKIMIGDERVEQMNEFVFLGRIFTKMRADEFDSEEAYAVLIPGFEGHYAIFSRMCERLKMPAVVLQPALEHRNESVEEIAFRFVQTMKKMKILCGNTFYLIGYSFGVSVVLEMAQILENEGYVGIVYCVDSGPDVFPLQLSSVVGDMSEHELQDSIVEHMFWLMTREGVDDLKMDLRSTRTWDDKVNVCMNHLKGRVQHSVQYARLLIEAAYGRICAARKYSGKHLTSRPLKSKLVLMKAHATPCLAGVANDYGLSKYTVQAPVVYQLDADHRSAPQDLRCSNIINKHLGPDILDMFSRRNLCDTYLLSADVMTSGSDRRI